MNAILPKRTVDYLAGGAPEGRRNEELLAAACQYRDAGFTESDARRDLGSRAVQDGLAEGEATGTIASAYSGSARKPIERGVAVAGEKRKLTPEEIERIARHKADERLRHRTLAGKAELFGQYACSPDFYFDASPVPMEPDCQNDWQLLLKIYQPDDIVWIGRDIRDSASPTHGEEWVEFCRARFLPVTQWLAKPSAPGNFTCPNTFKPGTFSRANEHVAALRFLVVESDVLGKDQICGVFKWMQTFCRLRAIVDTAGKSLHGWFDYPAPDTLRQLKIMLPALDCDGAMFKPSQPCRLPGAMRDGKPQHLLYLDPEAGT